MIRSILHAIREDALSIARRVHQLARVLVILYQLRALRAERRRAFQELEYAIDFRLRAQREYMGRAEFIAGRRSDLRRELKAIEEA